MTIQLIKLTVQEHKILQFWKDHVNPESVECFYNLVEQHDEYAIEAGPHGGSCEYTREMLAPIEAEIKERLETILERYADWATD